MEEARKEKGCLEESEKLGERDVDSRLSYRHVYIVENSPGG